MSKQVVTDSVDQFHKCRNHSKMISDINFCTICGISISDQPGSRFLRPKSFSSINFFVEEQDKTLKNMIAKQDNHRYYNTKFSCKDERLLVIDWMESLAAMLSFKDSTFYTACAMIDVILSLTFVEENRLKMVAYVCMSMAGKMEEPYKKLPSLEDVVQLFQGTFTYDDFINCEQIIFSMMGWNLNIQTPYSFASYFVFRGCLSSEEICKGSSQLILTALEHFLQVFLRISLDCYELYQFKAIVVGASIVACARKYSGLKDSWSEHLKFLTNLSWENISACVELLENFAMMTFGDQLQIRNVFPEPVNKTDSVSDGIYWEEQQDTPTQLSSARGSVVIREFECFNSDDENIFGEAQTVFLKFNV